VIDSFIRSHTTLKLVGEEIVSTTVKDDDDASSFSCDERTEGFFHFSDVPSSQEQHSTESVESVYEVAERSKNTVTRGYVTS
jgi:hypothetical protein